MQCDGAELPFETDMQDESTRENSDVMRREVTPEDRVILKEVLYEVRNDMGVEGLSLDKISSHGFSINAADRRHHKQLRHHIYSTRYSLQFPCIFHFKFFNNFETNPRGILDIPNLEEISSFLNLHSVDEVVNVNSRVREWFDFDDIDLGIENASDSELLEH